MERGTGRRRVGLNSVDISRDTWYGAVVKSLAAGGLVCHKPQWVVQSTGLPRAPRGSLVWGARHSRLSALSANRQLTAGRIDHPPVTDGKAR